MESERIPVFVVARRHSRPPFGPANYTGMAGGWNSAMAPDRAVVNQVGARYYDARMDVSPHPL